MGTWLSVPMTCMQARSDPPVRALPTGVTGKSYAGTVTAERRGVLAVINSS